MKRKAIIVVVLICSLLIADQIFKIWVKTNFHLGESVNLLGSWLKLTFVENDGMAFGLTFWKGGGGKFLLTALRLLASGCIVWIIVKMIQKRVSWGLLICAALIFAGAMGNIIDSLFYGQIFSESVIHGDVATLFPKTGGYAPFGQGKVVDMIEFDLFYIHFPEFIPFLGGETMQFFPAIFNLADTCITVSLLALLIFFWKNLTHFIASFDKKETTH